MLARRSAFDSGDRMRIESTATGCDAVFTLVRRLGMTDEEVSADARAVAGDLRRLRALCERMDS